MPSNQLQCFGFKQENIAQKLESNSENSVSKVDKCDVDEQKSFENRNFGCRSKLKLKSAKSDLIGDKMNSLVVDCWAILNGIIVQIMQFKWTHRKIRRQSKLLIDKLMILLSMLILGMALIILIENPTIKSVER